MDLQVKSLLENDNLRNSLNFRFTRATPENVLRDIYDGDMYKELSHPGGILHNKDNLSYVFNSDNSLVQSLRYINLANTAGYK